MKKIFLFFSCVALCFVLLTGCGQKSAALENRQNQEQNKDGVKTDAAGIGVSDTVIHIIPEMKLQLSIPSDWTIYGNGQYIKNGRTQLFIDEHYFNAEHARKLMKEFGYADEKECIRHYFYNGSEADGGVKYDKQELAFPSYRFKLTADKYYRSGEGKAVDNKETVLLQAMVDEENNLLHMLYFTDQMADEKKVDVFLAGISRYDEKKVFDEEYGLYRWQNGAEYFSK